MSVDPVSPPARIAVLASGGGSNLGALFTHVDAHPATARIVLVLSDKASAGALTRARERNVANAVIDHRDGNALVALLRAHAVDLIVLAGYLKLLPVEVVRAFPGRVINVHPALLPAFGGHGMYGRHVHAAVVAAGVRVSGVTVHFVDEAYDRGAIIAQWPVPVFPHDTPDDVAARVLRVEHRLLPHVVHHVASGHVALGADGRVRGAVPLPAAGRADEFVLPLFDVDVSTLPSA
jgi:formyltetrahydrofolate-dependent phosphoribosylglycinamide formyltransferase